VTDTTAQSRPARSTQPRRWLKRATRLIVVASLIALAVGVSVVLMATRPEPEQRGPQAARPEVPVVRAKRLDIARTWRGYGRVEAMTSSNVPARVQSTVTAVPEAIEAGRAVDKGQLIARLDASDFIQQREAAQAQLAELRDELALLAIREAKLTERRSLQEEDVALARKDLDRLKRLQTNDAANEREVDDTRRALIAARQALVQTEQALAEIPKQRQQVKARIRSQKATLAQAKLNVQRARITSPIAGVLEEVDIDPGESVSPGTRVARLVSLDQLEVPVQLPAAARSRIETGSPVSLNTTDGQPLSFEGEIARIGPVQDPEARTLTAYVELQPQPAAPPRDERAELAKPGMFLEAVAKSAQKQRH